MRKANFLPFAVLAMLVCCFPAGAVADSIVPPGNSAASQYTETFPTSKGEEDQEGKKKSGKSAAQILGAKNAHELESRGQAGKAVAEFTAETSPATVDSTSGEAAGGGKKKPAKGDSNGNGSGGGQEKPESSGGAGGQSPSGGSGSGGAGAETSGGSSGIGAVVSQATGTSSGSLGLLLPLILIAVVIWSAAYVWRNRQQRVV